jgi:hypothetical protein
MHLNPKQEHKINGRTKLINLGGIVNGPKQYSKEKMKANIKKSMTLFMAASG